MPNRKEVKGIIDFETSYCCSYDPDELDIKVVEEFKKVTSKRQTQRTIIQQKRFCTEQVHS